MPTPTGHWTFEDDSLADQSGNGNTMTIEAGARVADGALWFDGTAQAVIPMSGSLVWAASPGFALAFHIKIDEGPSGKWRGVLYRPLAPAGDARHVGIWLYPDGMRVRAQAFTDRDPELVDSKDIPLGEWVHLAFAADPRSLIAYVNGEMSGGILIPRPFLPAFGQISLGRYPDGAGFTGGLADLRIYNEPLREEQVADLV